MDCMSHYTFQMVFGVEATAVAEASMHASWQLEAAYAPTHLTLTHVACAAFLTSQWRCRIKAAQICRFRRYDEHRIEDGEHLRTRWGQKSFA